MVKACISTLILLQLWLSPSRSAAQALRGRADVDVDEHDVDAKAQHIIDEGVMSAVSELDEDLAMEYLDSSQITRPMRADIGLADFISLMADEDEKAQHILYSVDDNASELDDEDVGIVEDTSVPPIRQTSAIDGLKFIEDAHNNSTSAAAIDQYHRRENFEVFQYHKRIIGGRDATQNLHSFVVSLHDRDGNHYCGGTLISKDCVLTAAHCSHEVTKKGPITVVIDRHTQSNKKQGEELQVRDEILHSKYDVEKANIEWEFDFALLFLEKPTVTMAQIIELNSNPNLPRGGGLVRAYGWGDTAPAENVRIPSDVLQVATLRTVSNQLCDKVTGRYGQYSVSYNGFIRDSMMCAKNKRRDSCQGDSGGPLTFRGMQVGITSWGVGCNNRSFPGVYARISSAYGWIRRNVCSRSMYPDRKFGCEPW